MLARFPTRIWCKQSQGALGAVWWLIATHNVRRSIVQSTKMSAGGSRVSTCQSLDKHYCTSKSTFQLHISSLSGWEIPLSQSLGGEVNRRAGQWPFFKVTSCLFALPWLFKALACWGNDGIRRRRLAAGELVLKEKPLVTIVTPHTPKTLARYVAELRQKVGYVLCL